MDIDLFSAAGAVALLAASGAVNGLGEQAGLHTATRLRTRIREAFRGDRRAVTALESAIADPEDEPRVQELAAVIAWHAARDQSFARELTTWLQAEPQAPATQSVSAGRDAYVAGRDLNVSPRD